MCQSLFLNEAATLLKKRLWHRCFQVNFFEISKNTFFHRTPLVAASILSYKSFLESVVFSTFELSKKFDDDYSLVSKVLSLLLFCFFRGIATGGEGMGAMSLLTSISEPNKVQQVQFQTSEILLLTGVQKFCEPEISCFLSCMLQFL